MNQSIEIRTSEAMNLFKITNWIIICLSGLLFIVSLFAVGAVGSAGHASGNSAMYALLYLICLPISLIISQSKNYTNKKRHYPALILLIIGAIYCIGSIRETFVEQYGPTEYFIIAVALILIITSLTGIIKTLKKQCIDI